MAASSADPALGDGTKRVCSECDAAYDEYELIACSIDGCPAFACADIIDDHGWHTCDACGGVGCTDHAGEFEYCECVLCSPCQKRRIHTCTNCSEVYAHGCRMCGNDRFTDSDVLESLHEGGWESSGTCMECFLKAKGEPTPTAVQIFVRPMRGKRTCYDPAFKIYKGRLTDAEAKDRVVNVCSTGKEPFASTLSPFNVGPCVLPFSLEDGLRSFLGFGHARMETAKNMENAWQFSKVYAQHTNPATGEPTGEWFRWARAGFTNPKAVRFPMGRGAKPLYSFGGFNTDGTVERWGYVEARFRIYATMYADLVDGSVGYVRLQEILAKCGEITLLDFDGWNHEARGLTLYEVLYHPHHKCGHGFILAMMLAGKRFWEEPFRGQVAIDEAIAAEERHKSRGQTRLPFKRSASSAAPLPHEEAEARAAPRARVPEPPPVPRGDVVPPVFQEWARANGFAAAAELSASRAAFGEAKYGQSLMTGDGRNSIEDAKDELGDFSHYLQKAMMNGEDVSELEPLMAAAVAQLAEATAKRP